jgi:hypothetical protein
MLDTADVGLDDQKPMVETLENKNLTFGFPGPAVILSSKSAFL